MGTPNLGKEKKTSNVTFSDEFANFAHRKLSKISKEDSSVKPPPPTTVAPVKSHLQKPRANQPTNAATLQKPLNNRRKSLELELKKMSGLRKNNANQEESLSKNNAEMKFKSVVKITDTKGNLVGSKCRIDDSKKDTSKLKANSSVQDKNTKKKTAVKNNLEKTIINKNIEKKVKQEKNVNKNLRQDKRIITMKQKRPQRGQVQLRDVKTEKVELNETNVASTEDDVAIEYEETEETKCPYCFKKFSEFKRLSSHMMIKHKNEV